MRSYLHAIRSPSYIRSYVSYQHRIKSGLANTRNVGQKMYNYYKFHSKNRCAKLAAYMCFSVHMCYVKIALLMLYQQVYMCHFSV